MTLAFACAACSSPPPPSMNAASPPTPPQSSAVPTWMVLRPGVHVIIPEGPWPSARFPSGKPAVFTSKAELQRHYDRESYIPQSPRGAALGATATLDRGVIEDQSYGAAGAFLNGYVHVSGKRWHGLSLVSFLVPVIPAGVTLISVPDGKASPLYASLSSTVSHRLIARYTTMRTLGVAISAVHPPDEKSARVHVRIEGGVARGREGWVDLDTVALRRLAAGRSEQHVGQRCLHCEFVKMIPDFVAARYSRIPPLQNAAATEPRRLARSRRLTHHLRRGT